VSGFRGGCASLAAVAMLALASTSTLTRAEDVGVPIDLQVQLLTRVTRFERRYAATTGPARTLIVVERGNVESTRAAAQLAVQFGRVPDIGGREVVVSQHEFTTPSALVAAVERGSIAIVYLTPGLEPHARAIAEGMANHTVLTVSAFAADSGRGAVLSFELVSSRPRIAIDLARARAQNLAFNAHLFRVARVLR
jgi:hypothetical protein